MTSKVYFLVPDGDEERGSGILQSLLPLDRENGKIRLIPVVLTDSEGMSATVSFSVILKDVNDNPMKPGIKTIKVLRLQVSKLFPFNSLFTLYEICCTHKFLKNAIYFNIVKRITIF